MSNFAYIVDLCRSLMPTGSRCLDYGCGGGEVVAQGRDAGFDFCGCDLYYEGGDLSQHVKPELLATGSVQRMTTDRIPWPDASFDLVVSNQVIEHVPDLELVLREMHRVLKPGGTLITLFPHYEIWQEVHCSLPMMHRFAKDSPWRVPYATILHTLGLGSHPKPMTHREWAEDFANWIDRWTHYRRKTDVLGQFSRYFTALQHREVEFLHYRLMHRPLVKLLPHWLKLLIVRKYAGLVFTMRKAPAADASQPS